MVVEENLKNMLSLGMGKYFQNSFNRTHIIKLPMTYNFCQSNNETLFTIILSAVQYYYHKAYHKKKHRHKLNYTFFFAMREVDIISSRGVNLKLIGGHKCYG